MLAGSDFVVNSIEVAGLANVRHDYDIPLKYGVDQCIGDTIGPGGIFKALRTGPAWLDDPARRRAALPRRLGAQLHQPHVDPDPGRAAGHVDAHGRASATASRATSTQLAEYLELPYEELEWRCAGINHNAWFTELRHKGQDMYPRLRERARLPEVYERDPVRFEMMRALRRSS